MSFFEFRSSSFAVCLFFFIPVDSKSSESSLFLFVSNWLLRILQYNNSGKSASRRLKDRFGEVGRIINPIPTGTTNKDDRNDENIDDDLFDVEWVMGGKALGVRRVELIRTTAEAEGMTQEGSRRRRRSVAAARELHEVELRKAATGGKASQKREYPAPPPKKGETKEKKKSNAHKLPEKPKKAVAAKTNKVAPKPKAKPSSNRSRSGAATKKRKRDEETTEPETVPSKSQQELMDSEKSDLYGKQKREFEKFVTGLEKVDRFCFFMDDAPSEFVEEYDEFGRWVPNTAGDTEPENSIDRGFVAEERPAVESLSSDPTATARITGDSSKSAAKQKECAEKHIEPTFPPHPPYNFEMIWRRLKNGRYVLNREKWEEEERFEKFEPYYSTLDEKDRPKRRRSFNIKDVNPRVFYKRGVDWEQFRDDVIGMCDAALERQENAVEDDSSIPSEGRGSLVNACDKIKEVSWK